MSSEEVDICKNMVNHLLSENTNLKAIKIFKR